jgi:hypothetical protein
MLARRAGASVVPRAIRAVPLAEADVVRVDGAPATEQTEARVLFDADRLIAARTPPRSACARGTAWPFRSKPNTTYSISRRAASIPMCSAPPADKQFSPSLSVGNNLQYDTVSRSLGWQMRVRRIRRPGNVDLYLVSTHKWNEILDTRARRLATLDNRFATKLVYPLRF